MFTKILIANRGEIACRIARTAREMDIRTVAVYSDADQHSLHVQACDEAYHIGGSAPAESYLLADKIIQLAMKTGAQAIHPGFGFLSENADFAQACSENKLIFIGPGAAAIRAMGSKSAARQIMQKAGVPVLPGYDGDQQDPSFLQQQADRIGYPLLIKAVAGGGGKGLRAVMQSADFAEALQSVMRESKGAFGDDTVLLERYLPLARHIEIQLFADSHEQVVHLYDRDCSMQRRHQKVIEEAPAPHIDDAVREQMQASAIACARAVNYLGAGTVEFLLAPDGEFYFMEMNTRLQVEHPVSEMITGQDLVAWQLKVAAGQSLPLQQDQIKARGHAIEARIYAENPEQNFLPSTGRLDYLSPPDSSARVRIDTGVQQGDEISPYYDPMIAKLICYGEDREQARLRLLSELDEFNIIGPHSNIRFLSSLCRHPQTVAGGYDTRFIEHHLDTLLDQVDSGDDPVAMIAAALHIIRQRSEQARMKQQAGSDPHSPWAELDSWRIAGAGTYEIELQTPLADKQRISIHGQLSRNNGTTLLFELTDGKRSVEVSPGNDENILFSVDGIRYQAIVVDAARSVRVLIKGQTLNFNLIDAGDALQANQADPGSIHSPMPGKIIACHVQAGQTVKHADSLMVVEAMKMEHAILAPHEGIVEHIYFTQGDQVADGDILLSLIDPASHDENE